MSTFVPSFEISCDPSHSLVRVDAHGFATEHAVERLYTNLPPAIDHVRARSPTGQCSLLILKLQSSVHTQTVAAGFQSFIEQVAPRLYKVAIVVDGMLLRMQVQRLAAGTRYAQFDDEKDALAWLMAS